METVNPPMNTNAFINHCLKTAKQPSLWTEESYLSPVLSLTCPQSRLDLDEQLRSLVKEKAQQKDYAAAIVLLNDLIERHPNSALDYNNRGLMYFYQGQLHAAMADLSYAIELNDQLDSAYNNRGNCYAAQGNWAAALADYETTLDLNPGNLRAWINQGITFRELGLYDLAIENFDLTLLLGRSFQARIYAERGRTYHLRGDWNCASADYHRALSQLPATEKFHAYREKVTAWLNELLN
ncbi:MAG: tetratricopeptide repeat protein [Brasilonema sp.]